MLLRLNMMNVIFSKSWRIKHLSSLRDLGFRGYCFSTNLKCLRHYRSSFDFCNYPVRDIRLVEITIIVSINPVRDERGRTQRIRRSFLYRNYLVIGTVFLPISNAYGIIGVHLISVFIPSGI